MHYSFRWFLNKNLEFFAVIFLFVFAPWSRTSQKWVHTVLGTDVRFVYLVCTSSLAPMPSIGGVWLPVGLSPLNPFEVPLLNTVILLTSGATVTYAHHSILAGDRKGSLYGLISTIVLAIIFTLLQVYEYIEAPFSISDSIYGACFFMATGFHGAHVIIGTIFLFVCFLRLVFHHFTVEHHFGLEAAIFYWHFVDVVWLFLFVAIYWWGGQ